MTREEFIKTDEYITATVECIVRSGKPVKEIRKELNEFFIEYRNELLSLHDTKEKG
jgi:hypothetical protein